MHFVAGFQFNQNANRVALIKKNRPVSQVGLWNGVGGHVERGETSAQAMLREFAEETGVTQLGIVWRPFASLYTWTDHLVTFFLSFTDQVELVSTNSDELVQIYQVSVLSSMVDRLVPNVPWLIAMALSMQNNKTGADGRRSPGMYVVSEMPPLVVVPS